MRRGFMYNESAMHLEESVKKKLDTLLEKANVPTLPIVAQKLVALCKDDHANFAQFARVIEADLGMSTRLLRVANSAYYGLRHKATTLERAITVLGLKYVQSISLGFHLASTLNKFKAIGFDMGDFWRQCILRGVLARQIAHQYCPDRVEEAFLVGLLQDSGIPFLLEAVGETYARFWVDVKNSPASQHEMECELFEIDHVTASAVITEKWSLPDMLARPIRTHHTRPTMKPTKQEVDQLCQIGYFVGTLSLNNPESLHQEDMKLPQFAECVFGFDENTLQEVLTRARQEFGCVAQFFADILPERVDVSELLAQANALLSDLSQEAQRKVFDLDTELNRFQSQCEELLSTVDRYRQRALTDSLTGLATRELLEEFLEANSPSVTAGQSSLMVLFIDIDDFGHINNTYGHAGGDRLLLDFARMLQGIFGDIGCVARYGGDEFVVALMGLQLKKAVQLSEALLQRIRRFSVPTDPTVSREKIGFSCSIGMVYYQTGAAPGMAETVFELADQQMYRVKNNKKDGLQYCVIEPSGSNTIAGSNG